MSRHINRAFLRSLMNDEVSAEDAIRMLLDHLSQECPECRQALVEEAEARGLEDLQGQPRLPGTILLRVLEKDRANQERGARSLTDRLIAAGDRAPQVVREGDVEEYANPVLAQILLSRTWEACKRRQPNAKALALATFEVGRKMSQVRLLFELSFDYRFAGLTLAANAARIADELDEAFRFLKIGEEFLVDVADAALHCDFFRIMGSAYLDAGDLEKSEAALKTSYRFGADITDHLRIAKVQLLLAEVSRSTGRVQDAVDELESALKNINAAGDIPEREYLLFVTQTNLAVHWCELENPSAASQALAAIQPQLLRKYNQEARLHWIRGLIARTENDFRKAAAEFRLAEELFERQGFFVEAGLVVLDLAHCALKAGDWEELLSDAVKELYRISSLTTDPRIASQLYLSCVAVQNGALTVSLITDLYEKLRRECR